MIKKLVKKILNNFGYKLSKVNKNSCDHLSTSTNFTTSEALKRFRNRNFKINTIIDVGASDGRWSEACMNFYPNSHYHLIEAQDGHLDGLNRFNSKHSNGSFVLAAAGSQKGTIYFDNSNLFGGVASTKKIDGGIEVPVITIDDEVEERNLNGPYLIKLDTHGFEVPILEGAKKVISQANLIIIEAYNFNIEEKSLCFWELCEYMSDLGFRPLEVVDLMAREYDQAFWQMDIFFIKKDDPMFTYIKYR